VVDVRDGSTAASPSDAVVRASEVVGARVETPAGERIGRVVDLVFVPSEDGRVTHLLVGGSTFLGRFSVLRHAARPLGGLGAAKLVAWEAVERVERRRVIVGGAAELGSRPEPAPEHGSEGST
jgi:sporulation protein YlmC with PRC-barrel domain